jgi:hypothetical protein
VALASRDIIEAMQLGSGASVHVGGMAEFANFCKAKCGVIGLPFIFSGYTTFSACSTVQLALNCRRR